MFTFTLFAQCGRRRLPCSNIPAFTLLELLVTISLILVLAGLVIGVASYVQQKGARSQAEVQIKAISTALERFKQDNGLYPSGTATETLSPKSHFDPSADTYRASSKFLWEQLSGHIKDEDGTELDEELQKIYMNFKGRTLGNPKQGASGKITKVDALLDPFGNSYGYSTARNAELLASEDNEAASAKGYNPTFDLWSTGDGDKETDQGKWISNW